MPWCLGLAGVAVQSSAYDLAGLAEQAPLALQAGLALHQQAPLALQAGLALHQQAPLALQAGLALHQQALAHPSGSVTTAHPLAAHCPPQCPLMADLMAAQSPLVDLMAAQCPLVDLEAQCLLADLMADLMAAQCPPDLMADLEAQCLLADSASFFSMSSLLASIDDKRNLCNSTLHTIFSCIRGTSAMCY
jgi:hypothetical protein